MRAAVSLLVVVCLLNLTPIIAQDAPPAPKEMTTRELVEAVRRSIVRISTSYVAEEEKEVGEGQDKKVQWVPNTYGFGGTGFIIPGGYIVTNHHVVTIELKPNQRLKEALPLRGTLAFDTRPDFARLKPLPPLVEGKRPSPFADRPDQNEVDPADFTRDMVELELLHKDRLADLAVLRVKLPKTGTSILLGDMDPRARYIAAEMERHARQFAAPGEYQVGDDVVAFGFPAHLAGPPTVTKGIISALGRELADGGTSFTDLIQTDAPINPGNSGGPLFNMRGQIVGVNTYSLNHLGTPGIGFARSSRTAAPLVAMLQKDDIKRPGLGFSANILNPAANDNSGLMPGLLITRVDAGAPAAEAGMRRGDLLVRIGDEPVSRGGDLKNAEALASQADKVDLVVWRFPDKTVSDLLDDPAGQQRLEVLRIFQPDGAIPISSIKKLTLTAKLK